MSFIWEVYRSTVTIRKRKIVTTMTKTVGFDQVPRDKIKSDRAAIWNKTLSPTMEFSWRSIKIWWHLNWLRDICFQLFHLIACNLCNSHALTFRSDDFQSIQWLLNAASNKKKNKKWRQREQKITASPIRFEHAQPYHFREPFSFPTI